MFQYLVRYCSLPHLDSISPENVFVTSGEKSRGPSPEQKSVRPAASSTHKLASLPRFSASQSASPSTSPTIVPAASSAIFRLKKMHGVSPSHIFVDSTLCPFSRNSSSLFVNLTWRNLFPYTSSSCPSGLRIDTLRNAFFRFAGIAVEMTSSFPFFPPAAASPMNCSSPSSSASFRQIAMASSRVTCLNCFRLCSFICAITSRSDTTASNPTGTIAHTTNNQKIRRASLLCRNDTSIFIDPLRSSELRRQAAVAYVGCPDDVFLD